MSPLPFTLIFILLFSLTGRSDDFILQSELRTIIQAGSPTSFLTEYTYDNRGNRIDKTVSLTSSDKPIYLSNTVYVYDHRTGKLLKEAVVSDNDTVSSCVRSYNSSDSLICTILFNADNKENYRDSLHYNKDGKCTTSGRYIKNDLIFFHAFSYDDKGLKIADTLFESQNDDFSPKQAIHFTYDMKNNVLGETSYHRVAASWYPLKTSKMSYADDVLSSVTVYNGDGSEFRLIDSSAFFYDAYNNRIREQNFNDNRILTATTDFTWLRTSVINTPEVAFNNTGGITVTDKNISLPEMFSGRLSLYSIDGRLITSKNISRRASLNNHVSLPLLHSGQYILRFCSSQCNTSKQFSIFNQ